MCTGDMPGQGVRITAGLTLVGGLRDLPLTSMVPTASASLCSGLVPSLCTKSGTPRRHRSHELLRSVVGFATLKPVESVVSDAICVAA